MTYSFWEIAANTPWWVYALFIYLVYIGLRATRPQVISLSRLMILPVIFISLSTIGIYTVVSLTITHIAIWLAALVFGALLGWLDYYRLKVKAIKHENNLYIPGTWSLLIVLLAIFAYKFYYHYELAVTPQHTFTNYMNIEFLIIYGVISGFFVGKLIYALRCLRIGPYLEA